VPFTLSVAKTYTLIIQGRSDKNRIKPKGGVQKKDCLNLLGTRGISSLRLENKLKPSETQQNGAWLPKIEDSAGINNRETNKLRESLWINQLNHLNYLAGGDDGNADRDNGIFQLSESYQGHQGHKQDHRDHDCIGAEIV
jgi:hypothetical protein